MSEYLYYVRRFLGFTKSGSSTLGRCVYKLATAGRCRQASGGILVAILTASMLIHAFSGVGGALAFNLTPVEPAALVDTQTTRSVQTPVAFDYESRGISWYHTGVDLVAKLGTPVRPIMPGKVALSSYDRFGYGNHVIITHEDGYESLYAHLSKINISESDAVKTESVIGEVGSTGFSTGPHLHLEVRYNGQIINPAEIVPGVK